MKILTYEELQLPEEAIKTVEVWLARGDGVAVYENQEFGHPDMGARQWLSYGSPAAMLETPEPPQTLPDFPGQINWRYQLVGVYRREVGDHTQRITGYLLEHPHMQAAAAELAAEFGGGMALHLCDNQDSEPLQPGEIAVKDANGVPVAVIHTDGRIRRLDS